MKRIFVWDRELFLKRITSYPVLISAGGLLGLILQAVGVVDVDNFNALWTTACGFLLALGVLTNPDTPGYSDPK